MNTIIITHHNADLDALATMIAAAHLYKGALPIQGSALSPPVRRYLALHKDQIQLTPYQELDPAWVERVVVVDVRDRRRLAEYEPFLSAAKEIIVYDHHPPCDADLETPHVFVEPTGSCATMLVERLQADPESTPLDAAAATLLLLGIYADTGKLCFDSTTPRDVDAAAYLLRRGANLQIVNRYLADEFSTEQRQLLIDMMAQTKEISVDAVEIAIGHGHAPRFVRGASLVVHHIMNMGGHDAIFGVIEFSKDKRVQIIGRSRVPYVHVGELLQSFDGGGGHAGAGAATVKGVTADQVIALLEQRLREAHIKPTRVSHIMSSPVQTIAHDATLETLELLLRRYNISGVPVLRDGVLCGIISRRDVERARRQSALELPVASYMTHEVLTISPDEPLEDALELMTERDVGRLLVMDACGRLLGIISRTDMLKCLYRKEECGAPS